MKGVIATVLLAAPLLLAGETEHRTDRRTDFEFLHPEIAASTPFRDWIVQRRFGRWREQPRLPDGTQVVLVQAAGDLGQAPIFAAKIRLKALGGELQRTHGFDEEDVSRTYALAVRAQVEKHAAFAWQPSVSFQHGPDLSWIPVPHRVPVATPVPTPAPCTDDSGDSKSSNDLHHPTLEAIVAAVETVKTETDDHLRAQRLCYLVKERVEYNSFDLVERYIDADTVVIGRATRAYPLGFGECDEKAVVLVSCLRSLKIPARLKVLRWKKGDTEEEHACVEYEVSGVAYHLDPTRGEIRRPEAYRYDRVGDIWLADVVVMDADWPDDRRSSTDISYQVPDPDGDGRLNAWKDLCYTPDTDGERRQGYSYD